MKKLFTSMAVLVFLMVFSAPALAATEHCPDKDHPNKVQVDDSFGPTVTIPEGDVFCVKAANQASGELVSDGEPYTVTWKNNGGQTPGISYYINYGPKTTPSPEPSPSPTATPDPSPEPSPSVTPEPKPEPTESVEPTPEPTVTASEKPPVEVEREDPPAPVEELPVTGVSTSLALGLLTASLLLIGGGIVLLRKKLAKASQ